MKFLERLFCKHHFKAVAEANPISFFGIALFSQWDVECTKCGKKKYSVDMNKVDDWEVINKARYKNIYDEDWRYRHRVEKQPIVINLKSETMTLYSDGTIEKVAK